MDDSPYEKELEAVEALIRQIRGGPEEPYLNGHRIGLNWHEVFAKDFREDWLIDGFWPWGRSMHIFAESKSGKSLLMLWCAANIAIGKDPFTHRPIVPQRVFYLDMEMTEQDVVERLMDMGFKADQLDNLRYVLYPILPPLDTKAGGQALLQLMNDEQCDIVIIDTLSRVVKGEENSNDTYRDFHNHTGALLKEHGKSMLRLDHEGKVTGTSRGASSKTDDVDLVYQLQRVDINGAESGLVLKEFRSRIKGNRKSIKLEQNDDPVSFKTTVMDSYTIGVREKAKELDSIEAPIDISRKEATELLKAAGLQPGKTITLAEAVKMRKDRLPWLGN